MSSLTELRKAKRENRFLREQLQKYREEDKISKEEIEKTIVGPKVQVEEAKKIEGLTSQLIEKEEACQEREFEILSLRKELEKNKSLK